MATHSLSFKKDSSISAVWIEFTYNGVSDERKITSTTTQTINFDSGTWIGISSYEVANGYTTPVYVKNGSTGNNFNMTTNGNWGYQSSAAPTATYTIWATEKANEVYEYKFVNNTGYTLKLYYDLDTVSSSIMTIQNGYTYTLTCTPDDMIIDCGSSTIDGESLNDLVYWQRTSPTTGTKYTLGDSGDNVISLRSAGGATYTFTNKSYSPTPTTYTVTFRHYLGSSYYDYTTENFNYGALVTLSNYAESISGYAYSYATDSSGTTITRLTVTGNTTVYLYYIASTITVTFKHYLNGSWKESTTASVTSGSSITISNYAKEYSGYKYDHAENSSGTTITKLTVSGSTTVYMYYVSTSVTITFNHYRGSALYTTTTQAVNYGTNVTASNYKISTIPNCIYNYSSPSSFTATKNQTVSLYYIFKWTYDKTKGAEWNLTATEWNNLIEFVNANRSTAYSFTRAVKGNTFTANIYNEMVSAIGAGTRVSKGDIITAALMNQLVTNANNM